MRAPTFIIAFTAVLVLVGGFLIGQFSATPNRVAPGHSGGIFVSQQEIARTPPIDWKEGEARYLLVTKPGEEIEEAQKRILSGNHSAAGVALGIHYASVLQPEEFPKVVEWTKSTSSPSKASILAVLYSRWVDVDPKAAWENASRLEGAEKNEYLSMIFSTWFPRDEKGASAALSSLPDDAAKHRIEQASLARIAEVDLSKVLQRLQGNPKLNVEELWQSRGAAMISMDPSNAFEIALKIKKKELREEAAQAVAHQWSKGFTVEAYDRVMRALNAEVRKEASEIFLRNSISTNPEVAAEIVLRELVKNKEFGETSWMEISLSYAKKDPEKAIKWAEALPQSYQQTRALNEAVVVWTNREPEKALEYALKKRGRDEDSPFPLALERFILNDSKRGSEWFRKNFSRAASGQQRLFLHALSKNAPERVLELLPSLPEEMQIEMINNPAGNLAASDRSAADAYLRSLPEGALKERFMVGYIGGVARSSPSEAAQLAASLPEGKEREATLTRLAFAWGLNDPEAAAEWALKTGRGHTLTNMLSGILNHWAQRDSVAAASWVKSLPVGPVRDNITVGLTSNLSAVSPSSAMEWAASIQDQNLRSETVHRAFGSWLKVNPEDAKAWVRESSLDDKTKEQLLKRAK